MKYYTNVALYGNKILLREIVDGKAEDREIEYRPTLYVTSLDESEFKTLEGRNVDSIQPGTIKDCKDFISRYEGIQGFQVYGNTDFVYQFIADEYPGKIEFDIDHLKIAYIDIETTCDNGFPDVMDPVDKVIVITVCIRNKFTVFALGEYTPTDENVTCYCFDDEQRLLREFIHFWRLERPDIVTGWNVRFFDIPFLVNRIQKLMGDKFSRKLSPWNQIRDRKVVRMNKEQTAYDLVGISTLDYLELYQTFTYTNQESYKLDHIASVELGEKKVSYSEYDSIRDFYTNNFPKFVEYNIQDVALVQRLEDKLKLLDLSVSLAYSAKVNLMDIFSQVRTWDQIIFHYLHEKKIVIPPKKVFSKDEKYAGAYVKDPQVGKHDWVVSFDVNSLYPSLIMSFNISPETKKRSNEDDRLTINADKILERNPETMKRLKDLQALDLSVTANGCCYRKDKCGFLTDLMKTMYEDRKKYKKLSIEKQKELELVKIEMKKRGL